MSEWSEPGYGVWVILAPAPSSSAAAILPLFHNHHRIHLGMIEIYHVQSTEVLREKHPHRFKQLMEGAGKAATLGEHQHRFELDMSYATMLAFISAGGPLRGPPYAMVSWVTLHHHRGTEKVFSELDRRYRPVILLVYHGCYLQSSAL